MLRDTICIPIPELGSVASLASGAPVPSESALSWGGQVGRALSSNWVLAATLHREELLDGGSWGSCRDGSEQAPKQASKQTNTQASETS